jgi:dTDP-L-rhamnose 4-epimerase
MAKKVLITGGAGFVGAHVSNELLSKGYEVRALDSLHPQVHGRQEHRPDYLNKEVELVIGDVRDPRAIQSCLNGVDAVYHFASLVGVGQSMYEVERYTSVNNVGTAVLLEALIKRPVEKLILASSMSIYGEGLYQNSRGEVRGAADRTLEQLKAGDWEVCDECGDALTPLPTPEWKNPSLASVYALSKFDQERMCLMVARSYGFAATALRFFNIYGPYQALSNPYTGVLAIFASRLLNGKAPLVNEDGNQLRDFVSVYDIARAARLALEVEAANGETFNIASGVQISIAELACRAIQALGVTGIQPEITGKYRVGDIRHCFADIGKARRLLGFEPEVNFERGLVDLAEWLKGQIAHDRVQESRAELARRGLMV